MVVLMLDSQQLYLPASKSKRTAKFGPSRCHFILLGLSAACPRQLYFLPSHFGQFCFRDNTHDVPYTPEA